MQITVMKSKISYATLTGKDLFYVGSITVDQDIMEQSNIIENERVQVVNLNNGQRLETYVIPGKRGSKVFSLNGAAARLGEVGDTLFIISYAHIDPAIEKLEPTLVDLREVKS